MTDLITDVLNRTRPRPPDLSPAGQAVLNGHDPYAGLPSVGELAANGVPVNGARPDGATRPPLAGRLLNRTQLRHLPAPDPLIADTIDLGTVAVLGGYWGTCKSFVAQDWAASAATGRAWQGRDVTPQKVLMIAAEGAHGLDDRWLAWEVHRNTEIDPTTLDVLPCAVNLGHLGEVAELCDLITTNAYGLVVIDTLAKCMYGLDENSAQDVGRVVANLYRLRDATGHGTVVAVHHTGKDKTTIRGSSALEAGVDTVYTTEGDPEALKLSRTKRKDGPAEDTHQLKLKPVDGTRSAILMSAWGADITGRARDLMSVFMSAFSETGATKAELRATADMPSATFARSLNTLVRQRLLTNQGTEQRPFYKAVTE